MDALDFLKPRAKFTSIGKYWDERPESSTKGGKLFNYEWVDPSSRTYRRLFANIQTFDAGESAIRTNEALRYKIGGYVMTQDGQLFRILQCATDYSAAPKQAFQLIDIPVGTEYVLRIVSVDNRWGVQ